MKLGKQAFMDMVHKETENGALADIGDKVSHQMSRAYDVFSGSVDYFTAMGTRTQYQLCFTACLIHLGGCYKTLREIEIILTNKPVAEVEKNYCIEYGFQEPKVIDIS